MELEIRVKWNGLGGKPSIFAQTLNGTFVNVDFIRFLDYRKSSRGGYNVRAWLDCETGFSREPYMYILKRFDTEVDAIHFMKEFILGLGLSVDDVRDPDKDLAEWRKEKWQARRAFIVAENSWRGFDEKNI